MSSAVMNAVVMGLPEGPEVLASRRLPVPQPGRGEVLVQVHAAAVSSPGRPVPPDGSSVVSPYVPGSDAAGEVLLPGPGVAEWSPGDRVIVLGEDPTDTRPGAYAEYLTASAGRLHPIPRNVSFLTAASVVRSLATAWAALFRHGRLGTEERVVVMGAANPDGIAAVQICRWKGIRVIAVSDGRHARRLGALGATRVVSHSAPDLTGRINTGLGEQGATVVIDVEGTALPASLELLESDGRFVVTEGAEKQLIDVRLMVERRARVIGSAGPIDGVDIAHILKLIGEATFVPVIDSIHPLSKAAEAHHRAASPEAFGAVLLVPDRFHTSSEEFAQLREEGRPR